MSPQGDAPGSEARGDDTNVSGPAPRVTYRLERGEANAMIVQIPRAWRITFGPPMMAMETSRHVPVPGATVRVYDGKLQRAAWMGITSYCAVTEEIVIMEDRVGTAR